MYKEGGIESHARIRKTDARHKIFERGRGVGARIISHAKRGIPHSGFRAVPHRREDTWQRGEASDQASCEVLVFAPDFGALYSAGSRPAVRGSLLRSFLHKQRRSPRQLESCE